MTKIDENSSYKWLALTISFLLMLVFAISLQALPPIFGNIMEDIPFSNTQAGLLMSSYAFLGIFLPFLAIFFLDKLNLKKMIILALTLVLIGLIGFALSSSYTSLLIFRLISGAGATILIVLAPLLVTIYFTQKNMGTAMGIFNVAVPVGTVISVNLFGYLGLLMSWQSNIAVIIGFVSVVLLLVMFFLITPAEKKEKSSNTPRIKINLGISLIFLAIIWMIANAQLLAYITFGSQFFQLQNMSVQEAGMLTSMIMFISIFLTPIIGIMIDKTAQKKIFLLLGLAIMAIAFFAMAASWLSLTLWAVALGVGFAFVPVVIFSLLPDIVKPENIGMGLALITAASNLGIAIGAAGFGLILDFTSQNFAVGFQVLAAFSLIAIFVLYAIKTKQGQNIVK